MQFDANELYISVIYKFILLINHFSMCIKISQLTNLAYIFGNIGGQFRSRSLRFVLTVSLSSASEHANNKQ